MLIPITKRRGWVLVLTLQREIMYVHPDLIEGQQYTTVTNRTSKGKGNTPSCNVVWASSREVETDVALYTDLEEEKLFSLQNRVPPMAGTRSGQQYLKK